MKRHFNFFIVCILSLAVTGCSTKFEEKVREAVTGQLKLYPESRLQDIYKNFFQDRFGPGHIISDTASAGNYLREELSEFDCSSGPDIEPTGWEGNFYRVNLSVLKNNQIPYQPFFDAFIESVRNIQPPSPDKWIAEWAKIQSVIDKMNLNLPDYEQDKIKINKLFASKKYVMHHSSAFEQHYQPHYRIIRKDIYNSQLKKFASE